MKDNADRIPAIVESIKDLAKDANVDPVMLAEFIVCQVREQKRIKELEKNGK